MDHEKLFVEATRAADRTIDTAHALDSMRLRFAVRDVEGAAASFAVMVGDARTVSELLKLAKEANRLSIILDSQVSAALRKADTL
jgi:hypothetical protein